MPKQSAPVPARERVYLTIPQVAERYHTSPNTVRYWRATGYIPGGIKRGRHVLYDAAVLDAWDDSETESNAA